MFGGSLPRECVQGRKWIETRHTLQRRRGTALSASSFSSRWRLPGVDRLKWPAPSASRRRPGCMRNGAWTAASKSKRMAACGGAALACAESAGQTRFLYSLVRVSISILSPVATNSGTGISSPVASLAGFITLPEVSPLTAGSV